jgi:hypothetical protein
MARKIKIKWLSSEYRLGIDDGYRVRFEVVCAENMPEEIFVYREMPTNPETGERAGFFSHIASPVDLEEMPANEPRTGEVPEWFRLNYVDILLRSTAEAEAFIEDVREDVCRLKRSLDRLDVIKPTGEDTCSTDIECFSSSSSRSSASSASSVSESVAAKVRCCTGTSELTTGSGQAWLQIGTGAGSPIGSSDSLDSLGRNRSRTELLCGLVSQQLIIQGYDCFDDIPDNAVITGIEAILEARWDRNLGSESDSSSSSSSSASSEAPTPFEGPQLAYFRLYHPDKGPVGDDKSANNPILGPDWQQFAFGGSSDDWNANLTGKELKRGAFGAMLIVYLPDSVPSAAVEVDGVRLCVHWSS